MKLEIASDDRDRAILVCDEDRNDIAEFYHNEHATVDQSYETALALAKRLVESGEQLTEAGKAAISIRNELDRTRAERDSWKAQFESASAAASEYSEFWEQHNGDFDQFGNYIPYSQMDGDLRAAKAEIERLRAINRAPQFDALVTALEEAREYIGQENDPKSFGVLNKILAALHGVNLNNLPDVPTAALSNLRASK